MKIEFTLDQIDCMATFLNREDIRKELTEEAQEFDGTADHMVMAEEIHAKFAAAYGKSIMAMAREPE